MTGIALDEPGAAVSTHTGLAPWLAAGIVGTLDVQVAHTLARLAYGSIRNQDENRHVGPGIAGDDPVLLGVALACRAPGQDHICVDLAHLVQTPPQGQPLPDALPPLAWPPLADWLQALRASPLVAVDPPQTGPETDAPRPVVLDGNRLYLRRYWQYQQRLCAALLQRATTTRPDVDRAVLAEGVARLFPAAKRPPGAVGQAIDRQAVGAVMAVLRGLTVITGGPGTGKTTTIQRILALLIEQHAARTRGQAARPPLRIALAAPTGKAANRMVEALGQRLDELDVAPEVRAQLPTEASTLHRLLGTQRRSPSRFRHDALNPLPFDVVVVDEASMVDFALMTKLVEAVPPHARLLLLGDRNQLASVAAGAVLADICADDATPAAGAGPLRFSAAFAADLADILGEPVADAGAADLGPGIWDCMVQLTWFYRFGSDSGIGTVARTVIGMADEPDRPATAATRSERVVQLLSGQTAHPFNDIHLHTCRGDTLDGQVRRDIRNHFATVIQAARDGQPRLALDRIGDMGVLCAHRNGRFGVAEVNAQIESWLAEGDSPLVPPGKDRKTWYAGQPILVRENDYGVGLMNGDVGVIAHDAQASQPTEGQPPLRAFFADGPMGVRSLPLTRLPACATNYAMTIHKSQGSQYQHVFVVLPAKPSPIVTRELVYTGLTRASLRVTVVAPVEVLRHAVATRVTRASGLAEKLWRHGAL